MPQTEGSSKGMMALLGLSYGADALSKVLGNRSDRKAAEKLAKEQLAAAKARGDQDVAAQESRADPFRHQMSQGSAVSKLDRMERASYTPTRITPTGPYAQYVPQAPTGGFSYEKSPELINTARALKTDVMAGRTAPTMTNPANYGRTGAVSLDASGNPTAAPSTRPAYGPDGPKPVQDFIASYERRGGGTGGLKGAAGGAMAGAGAASIVPGVGTAVGAGVGALVGAIRGAVNKRASTAPQDFTVQDATAAIDQAISYYQGRKATPQEIQQILEGQGWQPGDRWVGEGGLMAVLTALSRANG